MKSCALVLCFALLPILYGHAYKFRDPVEETGAIKWFCAVTVKKGVILITTKLKKAQRALGFGSRQGGQAIIPIVGDAVGSIKPPSIWDGGRMWYSGMRDWEKMEELCLEAEPPEIGKPSLPSNAISYLAPRIIKQNTLLRTIPKLTPSYAVKFDFHPKVFQAGWANIIHLTTGGNCCGYGTRIPSVFSYGRNSRAAESSLYVCSAVNDRGSYCKDSGVIVPKGQWTTVEITQKLEGSSYRYTVKVGSTQIASVINTQAREFSNIQVYASDPWYRAPQGSIKNLVIIPNTQESCVESSLPSNAISYLAPRIIKQNTLLRTIPKLTRSYTVKFDFNPKVFQAGWANLIHLTTGGNCCGHGTRIPSVFSYGRNSRAVESSLYVCSAVNDRGSYCKDSGVIVPKGQWTTVEITQKLEGSSYRYTVNVGSTQIASVINTQPREFSNIQVYASDPWYRASQGSIKNLVIIPNTQESCVAPVKE